MRPTSRLLTIAAATAVATTAVVAPTTAAVGATGDEATLRGYAADTWRSMAAMVDPTTGLVSDNVGGDLTGRAAYTSPTNIGAYMWSAIAASDIGLIDDGEAQSRIAQTIASVATLEKHEPSGMFYNWYDPATKQKLTAWPADGSVVHPFLSSVDNGWLATALTMVADRYPSLSDDAHAVLDDMDFNYYYNPVENQIRGGFWVQPPPGCSTTNNFTDEYADDPPVWFTCHHYGAFNTEPRMASYLGIASGQIPQRHYFGTFRTFHNDNCDYAWTEQRAVGEWKEYLGTRVFEGAYKYAGKRLIPTWGGSMFEALMVPLFVPEETWGPRSWGKNHPLYVRGQIEHGLAEAGYGYWGFSPSNNPAGGYREYGVDMLGLDGPGYTSDQERTDWEQPYEGCREGEPAPTEYGDGVVTPHASFLAMRYAPQAALSNLERIREDFDAYGPGGFYDAVAVRSGQVSRRYLSLDQGMVMAALGNALTGDNLRGYVSEGALTKRVRPLMEMEEFGNAGGARP
ncbi:MAG TPA: glucoamylase family protein [Candidatus Nanopelagicales bacterium]|nr:glucoamylase family protein [Candidatus Nanopelagicales bacterium]